MSKRKTYKKMNLQRTLKAMEIGDSAYILDKIVNRLSLTAWEIFENTFGYRYGMSQRQMAKVAGLTPKEYRETRAVTHTSMYGYGTFAELQKFRPNAKTLKETTSALTYRRQQ